MDKIIPQPEDMQAMDVAATEVKEDAQSVPMKPVQKVSYQELRSRLPKEVTNDIAESAIIFKRRSFTRFCLHTNTNRH